MNAEFQQRRLLLTQLIAAMEHTLSEGSYCGASQHNALNVQVEGWADCALRRL